MKSCKLCWMISLLLAVAVGVLAYLMVVRGSVQESEDGRTAIILNGVERDLVLAEMREFLEGVEEITASIGEGDFEAVAEQATKIGSAAAGGVPLTLMSKLPIEFKTLGLTTHNAFDDLAKIALESKDAVAVIANLSDVLNNCTTCHSGYRLAVGEAK